MGGWFIVKDVVVGVTVVVILQVSEKVIVTSVVIVTLTVTE